MTSADRILSRSAAKLRAPAVIRLLLIQLARVDAVARGPGDPNPGIPSPEFRIAVQSLAGADAAAYARARLLASYMADHAGEARARVAVLAAELAGALSHLTTIDAARLLVHGASEADRSVAEVMEAGWTHGRAVFEKVAEHDPIAVYRAVFEEVERAVEGPEGIPDVYREPFAMLEDLRQIALDSIQWANDADCLHRCCVGCPTEEDQANPPIKRWPDLARALEPRGAEPEGRAPEEGLFCEAKK